MSDSLRQSTENASETNNTSNVPENNDTMETSNDAAAVPATSADPEAAGTADDERREMVISFIFHSYYIVAVVFVGNCFLYTSIEKFHWNICQMHERCK